MKLIQIRHAQSSWNLLEKVQGNRNPRLSKIGILQAELLAKALSKEKIDIIYSSPLLRSLQTAKIIAKFKKIPVYKNKALREFMLGDWEGKTVDELNNKFSHLYDDWLRNPSRVQIPNAERFLVFKKRVLHFFNKVFLLSPNSSAAVVTHGGVIYVLLAHILKLDFDDVFRIFRLDNTSITKVDIENRSPYIWYINNTSHLSKIRSKDLKGLWQAKNRIRV